jgi:hypothetical protein
MEENIEQNLKKKEITYRGKTLDELKQMDIREFASLLKANEKRTALKQSDELQRFVLDCNQKIIKNKQIKITKNLLQITL